MNMHFHTPVLVKEVIEGLHIQIGKRYIDATIGGAGHSSEIIKRGGILLGIDQDREALEFARRRLEVGNEKLDRARNWKLVQGNFGDIEKIAKENGFDTVAGILFDLGVSTFQIKQSGRGFSFAGTEPLDMRMNREAGQTAFDIINSASQEELTDILMRFGEEDSARSIVESIVTRRKQAPIETTEQLRNIILETVHRRGKTDPATKTFQALRIAVNNELTLLKKALPQAIDLLQPGGKIAVISFHSLEDRIVKKMFQETQLNSISKPIRASKEEVYMNPASRSAKLRIAYKRS